MECSGFLPRWLSGKESACNAGDVGLILEKEMVTHSSILALENTMDRGAWGATVHRATKELDTTGQLNDNNGVLTHRVSRYTSLSYMNKLN